LPLQIVGAPTKLRLADFTWVSYIVKISPTPRVDPLEREIQNKRLRQAVSTVKAEMPFEVTAAVILPDHLHFIWSLHEEDGNCSLVPVGNIRNHGGCAQTQGYEGGAD
jgi:hypothetical protein